MEKKIVIPEIVPEQMTMLLEHLVSQDGKVGSSTSGIAENPCFSAEYEYDPARRILTVVPVRLMPTLSPKGLEETIRTLASRWPSKLGAGDDGYPNPNPAECGRYNYVFGFFANETDQVIMYSTQSPKHGEFEVLQQRVEPGDSFDTHPDGYWRNYAGKGSGKGCQGIVTYQLADTTLVTVDYHLNGSPTYSANAGSSGPNMTRYSVTCDPRHERHGYDYLYVYVTIAYDT